MNKKILKPTFVFGRRTIIRYLRDTKTGTKFSLQFKQAVDDGIWKWHKVSLHEDAPLTNDEVIKLLFHTKQEKEGTKGFYSFAINRNQALEALYNGYTLVDEIHNYYTYSDDKIYRNGNYLVDIPEDTLYVRNPFIAPLLKEESKEQKVVVEQPKLETRRKDALSEEMINSLNQSYSPKKKRKRVKKDAFDNQYKKVDLQLISNTQKENESHLLGYLACGIGGVCCGVLSSLIYRKWFEQFYYKGYGY